MYSTAKNINTSLVLPTHSRKDYNWLTAELAKWKMSRQRICTVPVQTPENFDPKKKYPVIFYISWERCWFNSGNYRAPLPSASTKHLYFVGTDTYRTQHFWRRTRAWWKCLQLCSICCKTPGRKMPRVIPTKWLSRGQLGGYQKPPASRTKIFAAGACRCPATTWPVSWRHPLGSGATGSSTYTPCCIVVLPCGRNRICTWKLSSEETIQADARNISNQQKG